MKHAFACTPLKLSCEDILCKKGHMAFPSLLKRVCILIVGRKWTKGEDSVNMEPGRVVCVFSTPESP